MRLLLAVSLTAVAFAAAAQSTERLRPPGTVPLDEPPAPPPITRSEAPEPKLIVRDEEGQVVEEQRVGGKVYRQRVTPKHGRPYILMDHRADGGFTKLDNTIDGHLSVPQWLVMEF
jgi:hypothetical protein